MSTLQDLIDAQTFTDKAGKDAAHVAYELEQNVRYLNNLLSYVEAVRNRTDSHIRNLKSSYEARNARSFESNVKVCKGVLKHFETDNEMQAIIALGNPTTMKKDNKDDQRINEVFER